MHPTTLACPFCPINSETNERRTDKQVFFETRFWRVLFDHKPVTKGHLIVAPKEHRSTRFDVTREENDDLYDVQQRIKNSYQHVFGNHYNLQHEKNGLGIPHFQIHIIPATSKLALIWLQIKLFVRTFIMPLWSLQTEQFNQLCQEFQSNPIG
jgi:histidine triad (HIT) family protein